MGMQAMVQADSIRPVHWAQAGYTYLAPSYFSISNEDTSVMVRMMMKAKKLGLTNFQQILQ